MMKIDKGKRPMAELEEEETRRKKKMRWWEAAEAEAEIVSESDEEENVSESDDNVSDIDFELDEVNEMSENKISGLSNSNYDWDEFLQDRLPPVEESDEEVISDRDEDDDHEFNFIIKKGLTITNPTRPRKIYRRNNSILHDLSHPLQAYAKLALDQYNSIQGKKYVYKGLVKAYHFVVDGFIYQIRFKAYLTDQDPVNFQATVYEGIPEKPKPGQETRDVEIHVQGVYPLP